MKSVCVFMAGLALGSLCLSAVSARSQDLAPPRPQSSSGPPASSERLVRPNGEPVKGRMALDAKKRPVFLTGEAEPPIELSPGSTVLLDATVPARVKGTPPFRVDLGFGQRLVGRFQSLDERELVLGDQRGQGVFHIRRGCVQSLIQTPGETTILSDRFERIEPMRWSFEGQVGLSAESQSSGASSLKVGLGGTATCMLGSPVGSGRFEVAYHDEADVAAGMTRFVELGFRGPEGPEKLRAVLGWSEESLALESMGGPALAVQRLSRGKGWHRLEVRFAPGMCSASVDGNELAHGKGPGGPLVSIRLGASGRSGSKEPEKLTSYFDDLVVVKVLEPAGSPEIDATQDEVRLTSGDQVFGRLRSGNEARVVADVAGRTVDFPWVDVSGVYFKREGRPGIPVSGWLVTAEWLADASAGDTPIHNRVEGAIESVTPDAIVIATPYCGSITIERNRLSRVELVGKATRLVLDTFAHHLGDEISSTPPLLDPAEPEGGVLERTFELERLPDGAAWLVLDVVQVVSESPDASVDPRFSALVKKGELRTNVSMNGNPFDYLNRYITSRNETPERIRIPIPKGTLRRGRNVIRLEQVGIASDPNYLDDLGIVGVALEWEEADSLPGRARERR